jgi:hypothetical protein
MKFIAINATDAALSAYDFGSPKNPINDLSIHASQKLPIWQIRSANIKMNYLKLWEVEL